LVSFTPLGSDTAVQNPVLIVGAGHAGFQLAASLRQSRYDGRIALFNDEQYLPCQWPL
jgi:3-phenylpropionate/trans-cinnamate dioxygenase ferredoxin reductase component